MRPVSVDVCIIGGGIAGLSAAIALRQAGASVVVIDRRVDSGDPHRGDWLRPGAVAQLKAWGVDLTVRQAVPATSLLVEWGSRAITHRRIKGDSFFLPAAQLEGVLRERARALGVDLRLGWQVQQLLHDPGLASVSGVTASSGADFGVFHTKLVVGADGRTSFVREQLALPLKKSDETAGLLTCEAELSAGTRLPEGALILSIGSTGGGLAAPVAARRLRVHAVVSPQEAEGLSRKMPQELATELPRRAPLPLGSSIDPARVRTYEVTVGHLSNYVARGAVCVGEAAHPGPLPNLDGVTMAVLDAEALARLVGPALADRQATERALARFETERWPDNERRLLRARKVVGWFRPKGTFWGLLLRTPLARWILASLLAFD